MTHSSFAVLDNEHNYPEIPGRKQRNWSMWTLEGPDPRMYTVFPFFHVRQFIIDDTFWASFLTDYADRRLCIPYW